MDTAALTLSSTRTVHVEATYSDPSDHLKVGMAEDIAELHRVLQSGGIEGSTKAVNNAPSVSNLPETLPSSMESVKSSLDVITRKYKLLRKQKADSKRHRGVSEKFVCEHCGLKSSRWEGLRNYKSRLTRGAKRHQQSDQSVLQDDVKEETEKRREDVLPRNSEVSHQDGPGVASHQGRSSVTMPYLCGFCCHGFINVEVLVKHVELCRGSSNKKVASKTGTLDVKDRTAVKESFDVKDGQGIRKTRSGHELGKVSRVSAASITRRTKSLKVIHKGQAHMLDNQSSKSKTLQVSFKQEGLQDNDVKGNNNVDIDNCEDRTLSVVVDADHENQNRAISEKEPSGKSRKKSSPHGNPHNKCPVCHKTFSQVSSLNRHNSLVHKGIKKHKCVTCLRGFQQKTHLMNHKCIGTKTPVSKSLLCNMCGKSFSTVSALKHHENTLHIKSTQYLCSMCQKSFTSAGNLREHFKSVHGGRSYLCDLCGKSFSFKNSCNRHRRHHLGLKPFQCRHCQKSYKSREGCNAHELTHIAPDNVQCEYCGRRMKNLGCVAYHMKKYHASVEGSRHYQCYRCYTVYAAGADLIDHMKACEKNQYVCQVCMKTFSSKSNLSQHLRIHVGSADKSQPAEYDDSVY